MVGPCTPYVTGAEAAERPDACGATAAQLAPFATQASEILYALLGRQFPGVCSATVRPTGKGGCWPSPSLFGGLYDRGLTGLHGPEDSMDPISLAIPVVSVTTVKVDGIVLIRGVNYGLRDRYQLVRLDGERWPRAQNLGLPDTELDTFSIAYTFGPSTPAPVNEAAGELSIELWKLAGGDPSTKLPRDSSSVSRQGMSLSLDRQIEQVRKAGPALPATMIAMGAYNPTNQRIPPMSFTADDVWTLHSIS